MDKKEQFGFQMVSRGSYVDTSVAPNTAYRVEVYTLRLNHIALNEWLLSEMSSTRDCFTTNEEWESHKENYKAKRKEWNRKIIATMGLTGYKGGINITQAQSEVFTLVHIFEIK